MLDILLNLLTLLGIMIVGSLVVVTAFSIICVAVYLIRCVVVGITALFKKGGKND